MMRAQSTVCLSLFLSLPFLIASRRATQAAPCSPIAYSLEISTCTRWRARHARRQRRVRAERASRTCEESVSRRAERALRARRESVARAPTASSRAEEARRACGAEERRELKCELSAT